METRWTEVSARALDSQCAFLYPGVKMNTRQLSGKPDEMRGEGRGGEGKGYPQSLHSKKTGISSNW